MKHLICLIFVLFVIAVLGSSPRHFESLLSSNAINVAVNATTVTEGMLKDRLFHSYYFVRFIAEFTCFNKTYKHPNGNRTKVKFFEDDGFFGYDEMSYDYLDDDGKLYSLVKDYDDIFHPHLDVFAEFNFKCYCEGYYQSEIAPHTRQSRNQTEAELKPYNLGKVELSDVCRWPSLFHKEGH
uniref:Exported protein n=1 Tax=Panagrellus redivivus TaxID=6233 RepID=A0A7E4ZX58_PANRE